MSDLISLGHLRLNCPRSSSILVLSSSARVTSVASDGAAHSCTVANATIPDFAWVSGGTNMRLLLDIFLPNDTLELDYCKLQIRDLLTAALTVTKLWPQLHLEPSLTIIPSHCQNSLDRIVITLSHSCHESANGTSSLHRLGAGVPSYDIKPPEGVPQFAIEEVRLVMKISSGLGADSTNSASPLSSESLWQSDAFPSTGSVFNFHPDISVLHALDINSTLALIDAGLRLSISNIHPKHLHGIAISETSSFKRLEDFCPAIWRIDYLSTIASRAVFLPTVSHALSHLTPEKTRSKSLRAKLEYLVQQQDAQSNAVTSVQNVASTRLWHLMQCRLRSSATRKGVKPLYSSMTDTGLNAGTSAEKDFISQRFSIPKTANPGKVALPEILHEYECDPQGDGSAYQQTTACDESIEVDDIMEVETIDNHMIYSTEEDVFLLEKNLCGPADQRYGFCSDSDSDTDILSVAEH